MRSRPFMAHAMLWLRVLLVAWAWGCGGGGGGSGSGGPTPPPPSAPLVFSAAIIDAAAIRWIQPLGNLNPPSHALPTDHIYFYFADPDQGESPSGLRTPFYAPADGTITAVLHNNPSWPDVKLFVQANATTSYYLDHLIPDGTVTVGAKLTAGQRVGTTGSVYAVDLGVVNSAVTVPFLNPARYNNSDSLHAEAPLKYFQEPLRSTLYAKVRRLGPDKDGALCYDVAGRASGNWFSEFGAVPLSFALDTYDPAQVRISSPAFFSLPGVYAIGATELPPRDLSPASGKVRYTLTPARTGPPFPAQPVGRMLVQMLDDTRLRAETFPLGDPAADFTSGARTFLR